jgi:CxxC-x17-CxxC domain-containing protein
VRPETGTPHRHLDSAAPAFPTLLATSHPPMSTPEADRRAAQRRGRLVTYSDRTLNCVDCGVEFIHSAADQEYYAQKGFSSDPKRCASCRASRRASRDAGYDVREIGGPRGYERGDDRIAREYFAVICSSCGNQAQVPFKPRMDRPVYCSDCFREVKPD